MKDTILVNLSKLLDEATDKFLLEMKRSEAGMKLTGSPELDEAFDIIYQKLLNPLTRNDSYQIESNVAVILDETNGNKLLPVSVISGKYDRVVYPNQQKPGCGNRHITAHLSECPELSELNYRDGVNSYGTKVITTKVSSEEMRAALRRLSVILSNKK